MLRACTATALLDEPAGLLVAAAASGIEEDAWQDVRIHWAPASPAGRCVSPAVLATADHITAQNPLLPERGTWLLPGVPLLAAR